MINYSFINSIIVINPINLINPSGPVIYYYTEPGHGKGPSDGIGATAKQNMTRLILSAQETARNAYEVYRALNKHAELGGDDYRPSVQTKIANSRRYVHYIPKRKIETERPQKGELKTIPETQQFRYVTKTEEGLHCKDLSCACDNCISGEMSDVCPALEFINVNKICDMSTGRTVCILF